MKCINIMLLPDNAGTEQSFVKYQIALREIGINSIPIVKRGCKIKQCVQKYANYVHEIGSGIGLWLRMKLFFLILKEKPNFVISHTGKSTFFSHLPCKILGTRLIDINHGRGFSKSRLADCVVVLNDKDHDEAKQKCRKSRIFKIFNCIDEAVCKRKSVRCSWTKSLSCKKFVVGVLSRLAAEKDVQILLKAIKAPELSNVTLHIAGNGDKAQELENLAKDLNLQDRVKFLGWINDEEKEKFFDNIHIFCSPSLQEAFGISIMEAVQRSVPVLVSSVCGITNCLKFSADNTFEASNLKDLQSKLQNIVSGYGAELKKAKTLSYQVSTKCSVRSFCDSLRGIIKSVCD